MKKRALKKRKSRNIRMSFLDMEELRLGLARAKETLTDAEKSWERTKKLRLRVLEEIAHCEQIVARIDSSKNEK